MTKIVLQKALALAGVASRRRAEGLITAGRVKVNGQLVTKLGSRVALEADKITVHGKPLLFEPKVYFLLHKPAGIVSTARDDRGRKTVVDLVPSKERLVPVGRLDVNSTGLILLTNDGELTYELTHPKFEHDKEYEALIQVPHDWDKKRVEAALKKFVHGVRLAHGFKASPAQAKILNQKSNDRYWVSITLHEGRKHQVRQMINSIGASVVELKRVRMGPINLGDLAIGKYRPLTEAEIKLLK
ncbi:MAG: hypothetical protein A3H70_03355 [Candidatus Komeilibacteria bacterium RIFCSPLOWO2_02_FULL_48_11]|uniref:Pseudouridine synthase n=1 Tax=Candidatus Komeilibacteria bacterium RIFCSPLOWO2_02_FULL_48_11 TaxID=1798553 RepID=A0A1G2BT18_9BACT|nr:MAG: hypothetical protein A3H70_03355 [Candidatus Komeilibacteria bacterium RIFCSPLOWO2_02_FULL_48_11]